jgi:REP element-mobilizing transposase RayT
MTYQRRRFNSSQYYHIFQRGNHKDVIFRDTADRVWFMSKLDEYCERDGQQIVAYCLMDNHFHLVLRQADGVTITRTLKSLLGGYSKHYNRRYATAGTLFQGRFQAKLIDNPAYNPWHLARVTRYVHLNPEPFADYRRYRWSSYREFMGEAMRICDPAEVAEVLGFFGSKDSYATFVAEDSSYGQMGGDKKYRVVGSRRLKNDGLVVP